jgi:hypothetical protein
MKLLCIIIPVFLFGSGGYENGTSAGKGKFRLDITLNPFNLISYGQSYAVLGYGLTDKVDIHGYFSDHAGNYKTWYAGIFFQFYNSKKLDLATAVGFRQRSSQNWTQIFTPQLIYTLHLTKKVNIGGSFVNVIHQNTYNLAIDAGLFYKFDYKSKQIENISIGFSAFRPASMNSENNFLPTYSININFK